MIAVILLEYLINLGLLSYFHMHMFQLNSYLFKSHLHWMHTNIKKIIIQVIFALLPALLLIFDNIITKILAIIILACSIIYNFPRGKAKISFKATNRVIRMFIVQFILSAIVLIIGGISNYLVLKLCILNISIIFIYMIINFINHPMEHLIRQKYINEAKKILKDMPNLTVIGVTGSYGKTSVKNFLEKILSAKYEVLATPKNYNTTMGVVKTIRENLKPTHQIFICEMGATHVGEIKEICDIVKPKYGVITSIGPQHLESFKSIDNIIKTKFELADSVKENNGTVFLNYDNEYIAAHDKNGLNVISYGVNNKDLDYNAYNLVSSSKGLSFNILDKEKNETNFTTKLIGKHNIVNITAGLAVANFLGIPFKNLVPRVREIKGVEHRLQLLTPSSNFAIIDDTYNANPISSKSALDTLGEFEGTKIVVTPGLIELGSNEEKYNYELGQYMTNICDFIFLVGEHSNSIFEGVKSKNFDENKIFKVNSPNEAMKKISTLNVTGNITVLLENDLPDNYN